MTSPSFSGKPKAALRARALKQQKQRKAARDVPADELGTKRLIQELQIHQIELEMQNEDLAYAKAQVDEALEKFVDLYDFAPVGYLSLDATGLVIDANLTVAGIIGVDRTEFLRRKFHFRILPEWRPEFVNFLARVFSNEVTQTCELLIAKPGHASFWAHLESKASSRKRGIARWCRVAVIDITDRKKALEAQHRIELLTVSNRKLEEEIVRRQKVEKALIKSEQVALALVEESRILQGRVRHISHRSLMIEEEQRKTISRALHDEISQMLVGINAHLEAFSKAAAFKPDVVRQDVEPFRRLVSESLKTVHRFAGELRPAMLDDLGLIPALRYHIDHLPKVAGRTIKLTASEAVEALNNDKRTVLYRVVQEALANIAKHSGASVVTVILAKTRSGIRLEVGDNGKAFNVNLASTTAWRDRFGLIGMRERVEMVGGKFAIDSVEGVGTTIRAELPLADVISVTA